MARYSDRAVGREWRRRDFLRGAAASALYALGSPAAASGQPAGAPPSITQLSRHLYVSHGTINVGVLCDGDSSWLIDCSEQAVEATGQLGARQVQQILFTHHHRDQTCGARSLARQGARIAAPAAEQSLFADPAGYWNNDGNIWRLSRSFRPDHLVLAEPLPVGQILTADQQLQFGPAKIRVVATPGHTDGSLSLLVEVDGRRVVFCGDVIYDEGQIWDLYSLQRGFSQGGRTIGGYHGFMGDRWRLAESLQRLQQLEPDLLVPSHGKPIDQPARAVSALTARLEESYENYVGVSALRHYFPQLFTQYEGRPGQMPIRPGIPPPDCLRHFGTTWMLVSQSGVAFVMDVGSERIVEQVKKMLEAGEISGVEGLWVTHYHFDHTDGIPAFQREFDCPCMTDRRLADVLVRPADWRLPCLAAEPIKVHRPTEDGQSWQWREFRLTSYYYPGQTLYHAALMVEAGDLRMLFVGDSHTMSGIDDYCAYNRNWLGRDVGFQYCLSLIEKLRPTHLFNCHVAEAFTFTADELGFMRRNLDLREKLLGRLVPWDHANYGLDGSWVRCDPYTQRIPPGRQARVGVVITNHSTTPQVARCRFGEQTALGLRESPWTTAQISPKSEARLELTLAAPAGLPAGRYVAPVDVQYASWSLPGFAEAVFDV